jgi:PBP1b-binding outer membrane lipoprotein LpoB
MKKLLIILVSTILISSCSRTHEIKISNTQDSTIVKTDSTKI